MRRIMWMVIMSTLIWMNLFGSANPESVTPALPVGQSPIISTTNEADLLLNRLLTEKDAAAGQAVAQSLGAVATPSMLPTLVAALHNPDPQVRWRAATVLGFISTSTSITALGQTLRDDEGIVRPAASAALIRIGTAQAAAEVMPLLATFTMTGMRHAALTTLEGIGEPAVDSLIAALKSHSPALRAGAAETLGWIASPRATAALTVALNDSDATVRSQAGWALGEIVPTAIILPAPQMERQPVLQPATAANTIQPVVPAGSLTGLPTWWRWAALAAVMGAFVGLTIGRGGRHRPYRPAHS